MTTIQVVVVDDHPVFRQGLASALAREPDLEIAGDAGTASAAIEIARQIAIDVAVVNVEPYSAVQLTRDLRVLRPRCAVLGLAAIEEPRWIAELIRAGAAGCALKTQDVGAIVNAIRSVVGGGRYIPPTVPLCAVERALVEPHVDPLRQLSRREREIFELIIRGHGNLDISQRLFIAPRTVETHRLRITRKLATRTVREMQHLAARHSAG